MDHDGSAALDETNYVGEALSFSKAYHVVKLPRKLSACRTAMVLVEFRLIHHH